MAHLSHNNRIPDDDTQTKQDLVQQNQHFADTSGISANNRSLGFVPGFYNPATQRCARSRFANGQPAPIHVIDGIPNSWVKERDSQGRVTKLISGIVSGFLYQNSFYTRAEAAKKLCQV